MDYGSLERKVEGYASLLKTQSLEGFSSLASENVCMEGLQSASGRLAVLRELHRVFKWYCPGTLTCNIVSGGSGGEGVVQWTYKGVELLDRLTLSPESGDIICIHRSRGGVLPELATSLPTGQSLRSLGQGWQSLAPHLRSQKTAAAPTLSSPRRQHFLNRAIPVAKPRPQNSTYGPPSQALLAISPRSSGVLVPSPPTRRELPPEAVATETLRRPALDFSFKELSQLKELFATEPRSGVKFRPRVPPKTPVAVTAKPVDVPREELNNAATEEGDGVVMVRAKTKEGEAAYQWDKNDKGMEEMKEEMALLLPVCSGGSANTAQPSHPRYVTNAVKLSNNQFTDVSLLTRAMKMLVRHSVLHLTFLDLGCNCITTLPKELSELPLQVLYLHSNNISSYEEVKKLAGLTTLHSLTLWNNPLENSASGSYKAHVLYLISSVFQGRVPLRKLDHVTLSKQDVQHCRMYEEFTVRAAENNKRRAMMM